MQQYTYEEYMGSGSSITGMTLTMLVSPDYNAGIEYMSGSSVMLNSVLTDVLVTYIHPTEDYATSSSAITSMTLTG